MQVEETHQAYALRKYRLKKTQELKQLIGSSKNRARLVFDKLLPGQKRYLLAVSGITWVGDINDLTLSDYEIERLFVGLSKLKILIANFDSCALQDFKPITEH